jgi:hypothetical protein
LPRSTAYHETVELKPFKEEINIKNVIDRIHLKKPVLASDGLKMNYTKKVSFM